MVCQVTNQISVSVNTGFLGFQDNLYLYEYRIRIENLGTTAVKLISRHWSIIEGDGIVREVEGDGVVGKQPVIKPGACFEYESFTSFLVDIGMMRGVYYVRHIKDKALFEVKVPDFTLMAPFRNN